MTISKQQASKIALPILIILLIVGIWFFKNKDNAETIAINDNPDFALHVTEPLDLEQLKSYGLPIVIDFGSDSCIPCKEMAPVLDKLNEELRGKAIIKFVDVRKYEGLSDGYPINIIPSQMFFDKDGDPYITADYKAAGMIKYVNKGTDQHVYTIHEGKMTEETMLDILMEMGLEK